MGEPKTGGKRRCINVILGNYLGSFSGRCRGQRGRGSRGREGEGERIGIEVFKLKKG